MKARGYYSMTVNEMKRLKEWLEALGIPPKIILRCIDYLATGDTVHLPKTAKHKIKIKNKGLSAKRGTLNR